MIEDWLVDVIEELPLMIFNLIKDAIKNIFEWIVSVFLSPI